MVFLILKPFLPKGKERFENQPLDRDCQRRDQEDPSPPNAKAFNNTNGIQAYQGNYFDIPVVTDFARQQGWLPA